MILTRIYNALYCSKKREVTRTDVEQCDESSTLSSWFGAVNANDVNSVEGMIQHRTADVNAIQSGWSALHIAAWNGYADLCSVLLKSGADPDVRGASAVTPLCLAAQQGHVDVCRQLVEANCSVCEAADIDDCQSVTALHLAARNGHTDVVRLLLAASANVEAPMTTKSVSGVTALHLAVESGQLDTMDVLLEAGSNVNSGTSSTTADTIS